MIKKFKILTLFLLLSFISKAQDPQFSQFYAASLYLNPAFTGNTIQGRVMGNYRHQWPTTPGAFVTYAFSFDYNLSVINSGLGILFMRDKAGSGGLGFTNIGGMYSTRIRLSKKYFIRTGMHFSYTLRELDFSKLTFGDQLLGNDGNSTSETFPEQKVSYFDIASGFVFYSDQYWIGIAVHHLNQPNQSLIGKESRLPIKTSLQSGIEIPVKKNIKGITISSITLAANYKAQQKWDQVDIGAYYNRDPLIFGIWYRGIPLLKSYKPKYANNDAIVLLVGFKINDFRIGYSYDITISRLIFDTGGSHEISLIYEFASREKKRIEAGKGFVIPCAKY